MDISMDFLYQILQKLMFVLRISGDVQPLKSFQQYHLKCMRNLLLTMKNAGWIDLVLHTTVVVNHYIEKYVSLKKIPNPRKVSISPHADLEEAVTSIENKYVISLKPSPAILAAEVWDPDAARKEMENKLSITKNCSVEIIMKDISTVGYEPQRLWEWIKIASEATEL